MKKLILILLSYTFFAAAAFAGEGHDHGDSAFLKTEISTRFELSSYHIENLRLKTETVKNYNFYETVKMPVVLRENAGGWTAQGFMLESGDILKIRAGCKAFVFLDAAADKPLNAQITKIDGMMDPKTRLFSVYAQILSAVAPAAQGFKGEMVVQTSLTERALGIPASAVQGDFGDYFVFTKKENSFERKPIIIGHSMNNITEAAAGLKEGETVVTQGSYQLQYAASSGAQIHDGEDAGGAKTYSENAKSNDLGSLWEKIKNLFFKR